MLGTGQVVRGWRCPHRLANNMAGFRTSTEALGRSPLRPGPRCWPRARPSIGTASRKRFENEKDVPCAITRAYKGESLG